MKKILIVITTAFVPWGGLTTVVMNYYRAMDKAGLQIDFASCNAAPSSLIDELAQNGSRYIQLPDRKKHTIQYVRDLCRTLKHERYDVVHVHGNSATMLFDLIPAWLLKIKKRIVHVHNSTGSYKFLHYMLRPIFCHLYTEAVACSSKAGKWAFGERQFLVLNNAIDTEKYSYDLTVRNEIRNQLNIKRDSFVVGHTGKITKQKNHEYLIDIFKEFHKQYPDSVLLLVGDGNLRKNILKKVCLYGIEDSVIFAGMVSDVNDYLSAMDCFVFPSLWEGLPLALLEAQANGLKCIVSDVVTEEADVSETIAYLPIDANIESWVLQITESMNYDREAEGKANVQKLKEKHYDVWENSKSVETIYLK